MRALECVYDLLTKSDRYQSLHFGVSEMGKGKSKGGKYVHGGKKQLKSADKDHKRQMRTHESEERKMEMIRQMKVNQLKGHVDKQKTRMRSYIPDEIRERMKKPIDPAYNLKGAARVAREYYKPPGDTSVPGDDEARNLFDEFAGKIWDAPDREGEILIEKMILYAAALHNVTSQTNHAIKVFYEILDYDPEDHLNAKQRILRCYMDVADGAKARALIEKYNTDKSCCFLYNKALLEFISCHLLKEAGSSQELCDGTLDEAYQVNPYALFALAYNSVFTDAIEHASLIRSAPDGSIEDAISFFDSDLELWEDVEGAIPWVREWMIRKDVPPPLLEEPPTLVPAATAAAGADNGTIIDNDEGNEKEGEDADEEEIKEGDDQYHSVLGDPDYNPLYNEAVAALSDQERRSMYEGMFRTALQMAEVI